MTEEKWNTITSIDSPVWSWIRNQGSDRDFFLIAVGWVRLYENDLSGIVYRNLLDLTEMYADGQIFAKELKSEAKKAHADFNRRFFELQRQGMSTKSAGEHLAADFAAIKAADPSTNVVHSNKGWSTAANVLSALGSAYKRSDRKPEKIAILRDVLGDLFHPVSFDPSWLTSTVVSLAQGIYQDRAFDRMPILADALQDSGCSNEDILNHCRQPGEHVRGCFAVDLILGKF